MTEPFTLSNGRVVHVHEEWLCADEDRPCVIHNPSDHPYRHLPLTMDNEAHMLRIGIDGLYVLDPDSAVFFGIKTLRNSARCLTCGDHIQSLFHYDSRSCKCGDVSVDGGYNYIHHGWRLNEYYMNTSITLED